MEIVMDQHLFYLWVSYLWRHSWIISPSDSQNNEFPLLQLNNTNFSYLIFAAQMKIKVLGRTWIVTTSATKRLASIIWGHQ